jgi:uncharacterized RDD family membrane protein YckC
MTDPYAALPDPVREAEFYADVPLKRGLAWLVDAILIALLVALAIPFTAFTALFYLPALWLVVGLAYRIVSIAKGSATPGMRLAGIEFRTHRGERFGAAEAALHTLIYSVCMAFFLPQIVSVVLMFVSPRAQGLADLALGSVAINRAR